MAKEPDPPQVLWRHATALAVDVYWGGYITEFKLRKGQSGYWAEKTSRRPPRTRKMPPHIFQEACRLALCAMRAPEAERSEMRLRWDGVLTDEIVKSHCTTVNAHVYGRGGRLTKSNVWETVKAVLGPDQPPGVIRAVSMALMEQQKSAEVKSKANERRGRSVAEAHVAEHDRQPMLPIALPIQPRVRA